LTTPDTAAVGRPAPARPRTWRRWVRPLLLLALVGFAAWAIARNAGAVGAALSTLRPWAVPAALVAGVAAAAVALLMWRTLLADLGHRLALPAAGRVFLLSQLGKYVPGSVWSIVAQIELSRDHRIPRRTSVTVGLLAIAVAVTTGLGLGALMLPLAGPAAAGRYWWVALLVPVLVAALHPRVLATGLGALLRLARRDPLPRPPSGAGLARAGALQVGVWLCLGTQTWLLLVGLGAPPVATLPVAVGGYALAHSLGLLAVGLPAGAGVREAALTLVLSTVVGTPTALAVALLARAVTTLVDAALAGAATLWARSRRGTDGPAGGNAAAA
jgi:uncharacterized membrane protein YbhN (UPF0104 family)